GIVPLLETLRERGVDTAVVTNKDDAAARALSAKFFGDLFGFVSGALPGQPLKPAPDAVLRAMRYFGASAGECIYIGDSDVDVMTAKNAGLASVGVLWGFRDRKTLEDAGADVIVSSPEEIAALFPDRRI
ncbi:MAG: HAD family hydrolase, partial [Clostridiales bacterium]|nr:HAD family hydrolase [Clostridiales bacterium]